MKELSARAVGAKEIKMIHREVAELKDAALTNKTTDKVDQGDVFNSLTR